MIFKCADPRGIGKRPHAGVRADRSAWGFCIALVALLASSSAAWARMPARVVSINLCTDQLVLALGDPGQIAGLGRFSRHAEMSYLAARAAPYPSLRGSAEEVLKLKPDLVLAGVFSGRLTRAVLAGNGVRVETFAPPQSIAAARSEIERMAALLGRPVQGAALIADIESAVSEAAAARKDRSATTALALQRRGFVSGRETMVSSVMDAVGLVNASAALGITSIDRAPLESIVRLKPDVLVLEELAVDQRAASARGVRASLVASKRYGL